MVAVAVRWLALRGGHHLNFAEWATALLKRPFRESSRLSYRLDCPRGLSMMLTQ